MRNRHVAALLSALLLLSVAGCRYEATIDEHGGGTMKIQTRVPQTDTLDMVKARYTGPGVEVTNATMDDKKNVMVELKYADFSKLGQLKAFENMRFTIADDAAAQTRTATVTVVYGRPMKLPDQQIEYFGKEVLVSVTVPGEIVASTGTSNGKAAQWTMPTNTLLSTPQTKFTVTYKHAGAQAGTPAAPDAAAKTPGAAAPTVGSAPATAAPTTAGKKKKK
jgi:hypothetical protein